MLLENLNHREIEYLGRKLLYRFSWRELLTRRKIAAGWAGVPPAGAAQAGLSPPIVFALRSPKYFHLGDAYFVLPLVLNLAAHFGRDQVMVCTSAAARQVFESYGVRCVDDVFSARPATIFTFCEIFFEDLGRVGVQRFVYANIDRGIDRPVADWHAAVFERHYGVPLRPLPGIDTVEADALAEAHRLPERTVVVNDVVWSGRFRLRREHVRRLQDKVDALAAQGHRFCRLGARGEPSQLQLPADRTVDLRGALSIGELVRMMHSRRIVASVSYDNFFMHCSLWAGKTAFILCRERPPSLRDYMRSCVYRASAAVAPEQLQYL